MSQSKKIGALLLLPFLILISVLFYKNWSDVPVEAPQIEAEELTAATKVDSLCLKEEWIYGFNMQKYNVKEAKIGRNEYLADLLLPVGVPYQKIVNIESGSKNIFPTRNLKAGKNYQLYFEKDSLNTPVYMVYEIDPINFAVYSLREDSIYTGKKETYKIRRTASGIITSSLYETLMKENLSPVLAIELSEIYAWTIDFYHLQKGDRFKVIYYDNYIDGQRVGIDHIESSLFEHTREAYYAFYFNPDSTIIGDFFDECGSSLRKALLKSPLKFGRISSRYNKNRFHPILKRRKAHLGTDYAAPHGTPIMSVGDGLVIEAQYKRGNGNYVKIRHNSTYTTQYLHMSKFGKGIKSGAKVKQGQVIGYVGSTGLATGPHVCYRFWKNGAQVDPLKEKIPPSKPVASKYFDQYFEIVKENRNALDHIPYRSEELIADKQ
ncbi:MAG: peptidoglycan DD-metalloendopeptidase family protein [Chitinophagales bacterium]